MDIISIDQEKCIYTSCYCEENAFLLARSLTSLVKNEEIKIFVCFCSNMNTTVAIWNQKASRSRGEPVVWDYHVFTIVTHKDSTFIYDLDSYSPFPCELDKYVELSFKTDIKKQYQPLFRIISLENMEKLFSSNRSHMLDEKGNFRMPPPSYPAISPNKENDSNSLKDIINFRERNIKYGDVINLKSFSGMFNK